MTTWMLLLLYSYFFLLALLYSFLSVLLVPFLCTMYFAHQLHIVLFHDHRLCFWQPQVWGKCSVYHKRALGSSYVLSVGLWDGEYGLSQTSKTSSWLSTGLLILLQVPRSTCQIILLAFFFFELLDDAADFLTLYSWKHCDLECCQKNLIHVRIDAKISFL